MSTVRDGLLRTVLLRAGDMHARSCDDDDARPLRWLRATARARGYVR